MTTGIEEMFNEVIWAQGEKDRERLRRDLRVNYQQKLEMTISILAAALNRYELFSNHDRDVSHACFFLLSRLEEFDLEVEKELGKVVVSITEDKVEKFKQTFGVKIEKVLKALSFASVDEADVTKLAGTEAVLRALVNQSAIVESVLHAV